MGERWEKGGRETFLSLNYEQSLIVGEIRRAGKQN